MAIALIGLSMAAGGKPPAASEDFCATLSRVIAAAAETPPFASLPAHDDGPGAAMLGFPNGCGASKDERSSLFVCSRQLPTEDLRVDALVDRIAHCLPAAERLPDPPGEGMFREHIVRFRTGGAAIELTEGGWRTAGGGRVAFVVRPGR